MKKKDARAADVKLWLPAAICLAVAAVLLGAAFTQPKQPYSAKWTSVNEEVEIALNKLGSPADGESAANEMDEDRKDGEEGKAQVADDGAEKDAGDFVAEEDGVAEEAKPNTEEADAGKLDINRATAAELDALKGIGPAKAKAIVEEREKNGPFAAINDLLRVPGIGEKLLAGFKEGIVARP